MTSERAHTKKESIRAIAAAMAKQRFTPPDLAEIRRRLIAQLGEAGLTGDDYIADVLREAGLRVVWSDAPDTAGRYEEEFEDLLHFSTLDEAEMCIVRLDDLLRKFRAESETAAAARVLEVARLGRRRAEMISRNPKVNPQKRAEKEEIVQWFRIWLETPEAFFDWLELRKQSPEFQARFGPADEAL